MTRRKVKGYAFLAEFIASDRFAKSTASYRRFDRLSARNLLYLQTELNCLEGRQEALDEEDLQADFDAQRACADWELSEARSKNVSSEHHERELKRMNVVREVRAKIKEYSVYVQ